MNRYAGIIYDARACPKCQAPLCPPFNLNGGIKHPGDLKCKYCGQEIEWKLIEMATEKEEQCPTSQNQIGKI